MPTTRRKLTNTNANDTALTKEQRLIAISAARALLDEVSTNWEYSLPAKKTKLLDVGRRSGSLGAWRPSDGDDPEILVTDSEPDSDTDSYDDEAAAATRIGGGSSYRRATTPPPAAAKKRRKRRVQEEQEEGVWKRREDDSDMELNIVPPEREGEKYVWESPDDIPTPDKIKQRQRMELEAEMEWNVGLKLWIHRRDAWTQANEDGEVRVCESRFKDNPLYALIGPPAYDQIYTKVCMGGAQPPIPINLKHLNNALVEGWKKDDQWPPKPSRPEPSIRVKKKATTATAGTTVTNAGQGKKGRDVVKKVLGF